MPASQPFPLCREPWENYYILRRGIIPCCYGRDVIAPMSEWRDAWNSPQLQEIRHYLSRGELSPYCLNSPSCPIVQRHLASTAAGGGKISRTGKKPRILHLMKRRFIRILSKLKFS
jgi:hypothetical protein